MPQIQSTVRETDVPIDSTGVLVATTTDGNAIVSINIEATADASYAVDVHWDDDARTTPSEGWITDEVVYDKAEEPDPQDIRDTFVAGDAWLRVRVTDPAAAGETATVTIQQAH